MGELVLPPNQQQPLAFAQGNYCLLACTLWTKLSSLEVPFKHHER